jgi:hypothetical protein
MMRTYNLKPEVELLNKNLKRMCPFILNVSGVEIISTTYSLSMEVYLEVSPLHYCELSSNPNTERTILELLKTETSSLIKCIFSEWDGSPIRFIFFPTMPEKITIFDSLNIK